MSNSAALERFLRYARVSTQSDPKSSTAPSAARELDLARMLAKELSEIGAEGVRITDKGIVLASIPASRGCEAAPAVGFIAHMDTSPDAPGEGVRPQILRYEGGDVTLSAEKGIVLEASRFPEILAYRGEDIVFTDGTTLLGADDKAGIAAVMTMAAHMLAHPEERHAAIRIAFTPDEEIGRGTENFDIKAFGAAYAYTFDGGEKGSLEWENFNAGTAHVRFIGLGVHPGSAKGKMANAVRAAAAFVASLPLDEAPETTSGHEGFVHPHEIEGSVASASVEVLVRDHSRERYEEKKAMLERLAGEVAARFRGMRCEFSFAESYENMRPYLERAPKVLDIAREAMKRAGIVPKEIPIRGGTDGAMLSAKGLPCPNIFAGGLNFHGVYEFLPVASLEASAATAVEIARLSADVREIG